MIDILQEKLQSPTCRSHAIPVHLQVLSSLSYLSTGSFHRVVGDSSDIQLSQSSVTRIISNFTEALVSMKDTFVRFPTDVEEIKKNNQYFYEQHKIPNVVGLVDGTHMQIIGPKDNEDVYVNRCNYHSLNIQIICECHITNVVARWPGSVHDSTILQESHVKGYFESRGVHPKGLLLGDSGYPCLNWLLTPYRRPRNDNQVRLNK